ncbi:unnamed protein product [Phytophthora fragariaefolia]|uniref:Unnamed protein product n=1 Tax=Phytophthora fragariaefolia TaxID=1490495 RepID=A0A9W6Y7N1_9STRA|nr:unnamed protein product [Phytophthora fragariaefolia]
MFSLHSIIALLGPQYREYSASTSAVLATSVILFADKTFHPSAAISRSSAPTYDADESACKTQIVSIILRILIDSVSIANASTGRSGLPYNGFDVRMLRLSLTHFSRSNAAVISANSSGTASSSCSSSPSSEEETSSRASSAYDAAFPSDSKLGSPSEVARLGSSRCEAHIKDGKGLLDLRDESVTVVGKDAVSNASSCSSSSLVSGMYSLLLSDSESATSSSTQPYMSGYVYLRCAADGMAYCHC